MTEEQMKVVSDMLDMIRLLEQQNKQLIAALELYADDDFYNNLTDDVTANAKDALRQIQGVEES